MVLPVCSSLYCYFPLYKCDPEVRGDVSVMGSSSFSLLLPRKAGDRCAQLPYHHLVSVVLWAVRKDPHFILTRDKRTLVLSFNSCHQVPAVCQALG